MNPMSNKRTCLLAGWAVAVLVLAVAGRRVVAAPVEPQEQDDFTDEPTNEFDEGPSARGQPLQREPSEPSGYAGYGGQGDFGAPGLQGDQYPVSPAASSSPTFGPDHALGENNMSTDDEAEADETDIESSTSNQAAPLRASGSSEARQGRERGPGRGRGRGRDPLAELEGSEAPPARQWAQDERLGSGSAGEQADNDNDNDNDNDSDAQDSNIANAKVELTASDLATAAGHHHHHGHGVHGWLEMGAKTGKKGAFKWHDKHPVGGKGK